MQFRGNSRNVSGSSRRALDRLKESSAAELFYNAKIQQLAQNIQDLEVIVQRKTANVRSVEDVLRQKVMAGQASETG
ncbi:conserved hypothetical protein [Verticillium alfalfae VaMs.102]|uniref:Uncharacterized protein n=1 Tax=Verticillium alfalfae (strain VaMs.102 / ATCC MYA-4576 / FGSC 10136) TaxID=526221 RepID=C9SLQ5_VERA1|nr:conserved hypothetical protein [Verticillium alfalfae VaMs.102]EEY19720.1 conserved hypothetical protein [Verticillium alfalfae VaMs.102]